jgi:hypothetical protein
VGVGVGTNDSADGRAKGCVSTNAGGFVAGDAALGPANANRLPCVAAINRKASAIPTLPQRSKFTTANPSVYRCALLSRSPEGLARA